MPPRSAPSESKRGLIITLVFFILMTLGLGVSTYFGFADQDAKEKAKVEAVKEKTNIETDRDGYKFAAMYYRSIMGKDENINRTDLGTRKEQFDGNRLKLPEDDTKLIKELEQRFKWNSKENKPDQTYEAQIKQLTDQYEALLKQKNDVQEALVKAQKDLKTAKDNFVAADAEFKAGLDKLKAENTKDQETNLKTIKDVRAEMERVSKDNADAMSKVDAERKRMADELAKKNGDIKHYQDLVQARNEEIAQFKMRGADAPANLRTDWKIVQMDRRGNEPYINLGSADHLKKQQTFSIHGVGLDGRPIAKAKGTLEVIHVLSDHLSQARITSVKDPDRDPILKGDVLYNPSWNPTLKKHVVLAGIMDLSGDGRNSVLEFKRNLERQNVVVDAWLDPKDYSVKGKGMTVRTDYLIVGEYHAGGLSGRGLSLDEQKKLNEAIGKLKGEATKNGVTAIQLNKYLEMIGYRSPRGSGEERPTLYDRGARPDLTPPPITRPPSTPPNDR